MKKRFFMCKPDNFDVLWKFDTNAWMNPANRPDQARAREQWRNLYERCVAAADVCLAPSSEGLPDQVFFANAGLPYKDLFIMSRFYHEERQREQEPNALFFGEHFPKRSMMSDGIFEGQGDAIWLDEKTLIIGGGIRTNAKGFVSVESILKTSFPDVRVFPIEMERQFEFYHLDTCCFWMPKRRTFMVYPNAFTKDGLTQLKKLGRVLLVHEDEAREFVCNSVVADENTVFMPWANDAIRSMISEGGYPNVEIFPMSEFMKAGGAVKCLILEHNYPVA